MRHTSDAAFNADLRASLNRRTRELAVLQARAAKQGEFEAVVLRAKLAVKFLDEAFPGLSQRISEQARERLAQDLAAAYLQAAGE